MLLAKTVAPIVRMAPMMFESEDSKMIRSEAIVNRIREARHKVASDIRIDDTPSFGGIDNCTNGLIDRVKELST
jgi:hypothetical protein